MKVWYDPEFWFVWLNQIIATGAIMVIIYHLVKHPERTKVSLVLMVIINLLPAISLAFDQKLININCGFFLFISCLSSISLLFAAFFSGLLLDHYTAIKWSTFTPIFNSLAALFLTGALEIFTWPSLVLLGIISALFLLLCISICNLAFGCGEIDAGLGS